MAIRPKHKIGQSSVLPATRQFTDREAPQASFLNAFDHIDSNEYKVLVFYGVGGIGKSSLQRHLQTHHLHARSRAAYAAVDFKVDANRAPHRALRELAKGLKSAFKVPFPTFGIAYLIFWSKANPDQELKKEGLPFIEEGSIAADIIETFSDAGGIMGAALGVIDYFSKKAREIVMDNDVRDHLKQLGNFSADLIEEHLPAFFAYDLERYRQRENGVKITLFIDTYEALWQSEQSRVNRYAQDAWVRELVANLPHTLFVICGREKIRWNEMADGGEDWEGGVLEQHLLGGLSNQDADAFLTSCAIDDSLIRKRIINSSEGLPYYLDLCVDTYYKIKANGRMLQEQDFADMSKEKIFERFMLYLNTQEEETLKLIANTRFFTPPLFRILVDHFKTGYPATAINQLAAFSFITADSNRYYLHKLMRTSLLEAQDPRLSLEVHAFLFAYYNTAFQQTTELEPIYDAFEEALFHCRKLNDTQLLFDWYMHAFSKLYEMAYYAPLKTSMEQVVQSIEHAALADAYWRERFFQLLWEAVSLHDRLFDKTAHDYLHKMYPLIEALPDTIENSILRGEFYYKTGGYKYLHADCKEGLKELLLSARYLRRAEKSLMHDMQKLADVRATLSYAYGRLGELLQRSAETRIDKKKTVRLRKALHYHASSLAIIKSLVSAHPDNQEYFTKMAVVYERLGQTHKAFGQFEKAREHFEHAREIKKQYYLNSGKTSSFGYRKILIVLFDFYTMLGKTDAAKSAIIEAASTLNEAQIMEDIKNENQYQIESYLKTYARYCKVVQNCPHHEMIDRLKERIAFRKVSEY